MLRFDGEAPGKQGHCRNKNEKKNPRVHRFIFDEKGIEQSSSWEMAKYHGKKFANYDVVADLCCGIGMDLIHIADNKKMVYAVDTDSQKLAAAQFNAADFSSEANILFAAYPAEDFCQKVDAIFIDPDRRPSAKRIIEPEMMSPPLSAILKLGKITPHILLKLSPVFSYRKLDLDQNYTLEFISEKGSLKEILLGFGNFAQKGISKKAILLNEGIELTNAMPKRKQISSFQTYLFEPDAAIIRSGLVQQCAEILEYDRVDEKIALLTGDKIVPTKMGHYFEIEAYFKYHKKQLQKYLTSNKIGILEIKTRGFPLSVETFRKKLKLKGNEKKTLFIIRLAERHICLICKRMKENAC